VCLLHCTELRFYMLSMVTQSNWRWWCCVCWLHCTELLVDMLCCGNTIQIDVVVLCVLVALY